MLFCCQSESLRGGCIPHPPHPPKSPPPHTDMHLLCREPTDGNCPLFKEALETYMATAGTHYRTASVSSPLAECQLECRVQAPTTAQIL